MFATVKETVERLARGLALAATAAMTLSFLWVAFKRLRYPYELEWMAGAVLDHVERVRNGLPLYVAPTSDWIPFMYPPLYYWVAALATRIWPEFAGCRAVSIAATLVQALCIWRLARRHGASRFWSVLALGLFFACFSFTAYWYDLERADPLLMAMICVATVVLVETRGLTAAALAGLLMGAAFLAKQQALLFAAAGLLALLVRRERARALVFGLCAFGLVTASILVLDARSGGWFRYYVLRIPLAHGMEWRLIYTFFVEDVARGFVLTVATVAALARWTRAARRGMHETTVLACMLAAGLLAAAASRLHQGGWNNALLLWTDFACVAVAVLATQTELSSRQVLVPLCALVALQLGLLSYDPDDVVPGPPRAQAAARFEQRIKRLESGGEVLVQGRGHVTARRHFHIAALVDVLRADGHLRAAIADDFRRQRFAAFLIDELQELRLTYLLHRESEMFPLVAAHYYIAERTDDRERPPLVGWHAQPTWILKPRREPLVGWRSEALQRRLRIEMGLAEMRMRVAQAGAALDPSTPSIEQLAAEIDRQSALGER